MNNGVENFVYFLSITRKIYRMKGWLIKPNR